MIFPNVDINTYICMYTNFQKTSLRDCLDSDLNKGPKLNLRILLEDFIIEENN